MLLVEVLVSSSTQLAADNIPSNPFLMKAKVEFVRLDPLSGMGHAVQRSTGRHAKFIVPYIILKPYAFPGS